MLQVEVHQLRETQARAVHHLQHCAVANGQRIVKIDIQQAVYVVDVDIFRQMTRGFRRGDPFRRVGFQTALTDQPVEETAQGRESERRARRA